MQISRDLQPSYPRYHVSRVVETSNHHVFARGSSPKKTLVAIITREWWAYQLEIWMEIPNRKPGEPRFNLKDGQKEEAAEKL